MPIVANGVSMVNFPGPNTDRILPETIVRIFFQQYSFLGKLIRYLDVKGMHPCQKQQPFLLHLQRLKYRLELEFNGVLELLH
jgi:hypothetical protein